MLKPTSLPREEVVSIVSHLDKDGDGKFKLLIGFLSFIFGKVSN
jgi:hypothetical protein